MNAVGKVVAVALTTAAVLVASASVNQKLALTEKRRVPPSPLVSGTPFRENFVATSRGPSIPLSAESPLAGVDFRDLVDDVGSAEPSSVKDAVRTVTGLLGPTGITERH